MNSHLQSKESLKNNIVLNVWHVKERLVRWSIGSGGSDIVPVVVLEAVVEEEALEEPELHCAQCLPQSLHLLRDM